MKLSSLITEVTEVDINYKTEYRCIGCGTNIVEHKCKKDKKYKVKKKIVFYLNNRPFVLLGAGKVREGKINKKLHCIRMISPSNSKQGIYWSRVRWSNYFDIDVDI